MIKLHHLRIGRSIFTVWLFEEVSVEYILEVYHRNPETMRAPSSLQAIHPLGKSPVIEDGELILSESGAITEYILSKYDTEYRFHPNPQNVQERARYNQWLTYPEGSVFAPLLIKLLLTRSGVEHPVATPFSDGEFKLHFDHITRQLNDSEFILGDTITGADFGITYMVSMADRLGLLTGYEQLKEYLVRMTARDAFTRAIERAVE